MLTGLRAEGAHHLLLELFIRQSANAGAKNPNRLCREVAMAGAFPGHLVRQTSGKDDLSHGLRPSPACGSASPCLEAKLSMRLFHLRLASAARSVPDFAGPADCKP
jgi:hypothetical protein